MQRSRVQLPSAPLGSLSCRAAALPAHCLFDLPACSLTLNRRLSTMKSLAHVIRVPAHRCCRVALISGRGPAFLRPAKVLLMNGSSPRLIVAALLLTACFVAWPRAASAQPSLSHLT